MLIFQKEKEALEVYWSGKTCLRSGNCEEINQAKMVVFGKEPSSKKIEGIYFKVNGAAAYKTRGRF